MALKIGIYIARTGARKDDPGPPRIYKVVRVTKTGLEYETCASVYKDEWHRVGTGGRKWLEEHFAAGVYFPAEYWQQFRMYIMSGAPEIGVPCYACNGSGMRSTMQDKCAGCQGTGHQKKRPGVECPDCKGVGKRAPEGQRPNPTPKAPKTPEHKHKPMTQVKAKAAARKLATPDLGAF